MLRSTNKRRRAVLGLLLGGALLSSGFARAEARDLPEIRERGIIRIALYNDFPPYSLRDRGIDLDVAEALAGKLKVRLDPMWFNADENVDDDLRNMVWKGHYLGTGPADAMIHVPVDPALAQRNPRVRMVAPYHRERLAVARRLSDLPTLDDLSQLNGLPVGAEDASLASIVLVSGNDGGLRGTVRHFKTPAAAVEALKKGELVAVMAQQAELLGLLGQAPGIVVAPPPVVAGLGTRQWVLGVAVRKDHVSLGDALEQAMSELAADGSLDRIFAKHGVSRVRP